MDDRRARARSLVTAALDAVEAELVTPTQPLCREQLARARDTLREYLRGIEAGALPPRRDRGEGLGRMVLDGWPYDLPLSALVLQAERAWRNA